MTKIAAALAALTIATLSTGCINMSTKRPTGGGGSITRQAPQSDRVDPLAGTESPFEKRADLGER